jgi:hypothetical protein
MAQAVECLLSKCDTLHSNVRPPKQGESLKKNPYLPIKHSVSKSPVKILFLC